MKSTATGKSFTYTPPLHHRQARRAEGHGKGAIRVTEDFGITVLVNFVSQPKLAGYGDKTVAWCCECHRGERFFGDEGPAKVRVKARATFRVRVKARATFRVRVKAKVRVRVTFKVRFTVT